MNKNIFNQIIDRLKEKYKIQDWWVGYSAFEVLVGVILSQATERKNNIVAFENLRRRMIVDPNNLRKADIDVIKECIKPAGLHNVKAVYIRECAKFIHEYYNDNLGCIFSLDVADARKKLMELPGVGKKTADILLNFIGNKDTFPIDTHIARIAKRWGIVSSKADYEDIRSCFEKLVDSNDRRFMHLALIEFGREYCNAKKPKCNICPINDCCGGSG